VVGRVFETQERKKERNTGFLWLYIQKYRVLMVIQGSFADIYVFSSCRFTWLQVTSQGIWIYNLCCGCIGVFCGYIRLFCRYVGFFSRFFKWLEATLQSIYADIQASFGCIGLFCGYVGPVCGQIWLFCGYIGLLRIYRVLSNT